jgi:hypothetical protein
MKIKIPGGYSHGMYIAPNSEHKHEHEYLLDKNHTFKFHPKPTYYMRDGKMIREWNVELHPHHDMTVPFDELSHQHKITRVLSPAATHDDLEKAASSDQIELKAAAAKHPNIDQSTLAKLATDFSPKVRHAAYINPNLPSHIIDSALSKNDMVASAFAHRPHLEDRHKVAMIHSDFPSISAAVATRHDLEPHHVKALLGDNVEETHHSIVKAIARNESVDPDVLHELIHHSDSSVKEALAQNPSIHRKTVVHLISHGNGVVSGYARNNRSQFKMQKTN